jgi:putative hydrolase of the HAD superfamily
MDEFTGGLEAWCSDLGVTVLAVDADDTLWHDNRYFRWLTESLLAFAHELGFSREAALAQLDIARGNVQRGENGFAAAVRAVGLAFVFPAKVMAQLELQIHGFLAHSLDLFPHALEVLDGLSRLHKVLLTKGSSVEQHRKVEIAGIRDLFDEIVVLESKSRISLENFCFSRQFEPAQLLVIGNSVQHDIMPAFELGARAIWFNHPENAFGRNMALPPGVIEVDSWEAFRPRYR